MKLSDFDYKLPEELIAYYPKKRGKSRLLVLNRENQNIEDKNFSDIVNILPFPIYIVRNITKVVKTRIYAYRKTGAKIEILILNPYNKDNSFEALINKGGRLKTNEELIIDNENNIEIIGRKDEVFEIKINTKMNIYDFFDKFGHVPLPPYIKREDEKQDKNTYQTVFSKIEGSSAAPTAGLHFSNKLINTLEEKGAVFVDMILHVGLGTFQPVNTENIEEHKMHSEYYEALEEEVKKLNYAKKNNIPILAIGTTSLRVLETIFYNNEFHAQKGETDIFIYPPYKIKSINMLITNFHLPKSTLLMLVSAFAGKDFIMKAYSHAIKNKYRFFSYGDAMLIK